MQDLLFHIELLTEWQIYIHLQLIFIALSFITEGSKGLDFDFKISKTFWGYTLDAMAGGWPQCMSASIFQPHIATYFRVWLRLWLIAWSLTSAFLQSGNTDIWISYAVLYLNRGTFPQMLNCVYRITFRCLSSVCAASCSPRRHADVGFGCFCFFLARSSPSTRYATELSTTFPGQPMST